MPCNCKICVLRLITWHYNYLLRIFISYLKPSVCKQIAMIKWKYFFETIKLLILDENTWYYTTVCKIRSIGWISAKFTGYKNGRNVWRQIQRKIARLVVTEKHHSNEKDVKWYVFFNWWNENILFFQKTYSISDEETTWRPPKNKIFLCPLSYTDWHLTNLPNTCVTVSRTHPRELSRLTLCCLSDNHIAQQRCPLYNKNSWKTIKNLYINIKWKQFSNLLA